MSDAINPAHYRDGDKGECIDAMPKFFETWLHENGRGDPPGGFGELQRRVQFMMLGFCLGNAFKYRWRKGRKDDVDQEVGKARWYDAFALHVLHPDRNRDPRSSR